MGAFVDMGRLLMMEGQLNMEQLIRNDLLASTVDKM